MKHLELDNQSKQNCSRKVSTIQTEWFPGGISLVWFEVKISFCNFWFIFLSGWPSCMFVERILSGINEIRSMSVVGLRKRLIFITNTVHLALWRKFSMKSQSFHFCYTCITCSQTLMHLWYSDDKSDDEHSGYINVWEKVSRLQQREWTYSILRQEIVSAVHHHCRGVHQLSGRLANRQLKQKQLILWSYKVEWVTYVVMSKKN